VDTVLSPASRRLLRIYLRPLRTRVALLAALLALGVALQLLNPQIVRAFIDTAQAGGPQSTLVGAALLFLGVAVATQVAGVAEAYVAADVGWRATNALRLDLARHCLGLDPGFHHAHTPGELIARVDGDVSTLANFLSRFVLLVLGSLLLLVGVLALLIREDWRLGLLFTLLSAVGLAASFWVRRITSRYAAAQRQAVADLEGFVEERLYALPDVRANAMQPHLLYRLGLALRETYLRARAMVVAGNTLGWVTGATSLLSALLTLGAGAALYSRGEVTLGTVYLLFQYQALLRRPLGEMTRQLQDFQRAGAAVERVQRLADITPSVPDGPGAALPPGPLAVEFDAVDFAYAPQGAAPRVLRGVSFTVRPREVLGLLGRTGSGKTTITRLLLRLYDPTAGRVLLGGVDLRRLRRDGLRREVAMVTQDVQLFRSTVRDNLTLFDRSVPEGSVLGALERLGLLPWLERLPRGLDTPLGPGGEGLSAGEAQLLACGRVFLRDPRVVVLDEASSRLDPATERLISGAIDRLLEGRTGIVVAHRLETVQRTDAVLVLEGGRVVEWGPRAALGADPRSRYAALLRSAEATAEVLA
jgi:ATP-binding cassette, subfamily B, bacterial